MGASSNQRVTHKMCSGLNDEGACASRESQERQQEDELKVVLYESKINRAWYGAKFKLQNFTCLLLGTRDY